MRDSDLEFMAPKRQFVMWARLFRNASHLTLALSLFMSGDKKVLFCVNGTRAKLDGFKGALSYRRSAHRTNGAHEDARNGSLRTVWMSSSTLSLIGPC